MLHAILVCIPPKSHWTMAKKRVALREHFLESYRVDFQGFSHVDLSLYDFISRTT